MISGTDKSPSQCRSGRLRLMLVVMAPVLLLSLLWWFKLRPPTADEVAQLTADALAKGDVDTLIALTAPEEVDKLHLTKQGILGILEETLHHVGAPGPLSVERVQSYPVDQLAYRLSSSKGGGPRSPYHMMIYVTESPDNRWHLATGYFLLSCCSYGMEDRTPRAIADRFWPLAKKYGIKGVRLNTTGYVFARGEAH